MITAGFQDKLVLLRGYTESAAGIDELGLPTLTVPHLFIPDKLVTSLSGPPSGFKKGRSRSASFADCMSQAPRALTPLPPSSLQTSCTPNIEDSQPESSPALPILEGLPAQPVSAPNPVQEDPLPFSSEPLVPVTRPLAPPSYKSALQTAQAAQVATAKVVRSRPATPELDANGSSASSDTSDETPDARASPTLPRSRHVNPNVVE